MKFNLAAAAVAVAVMFGLTSCATPAPTVSSPASAVAAELPQSGGGAQPAAPDLEPIPTVEAPAPADNGGEYRAIYRKLLGGNVPGNSPYMERVILLNSAANRNNTFDADDWCFIVYGGTVEPTESPGIYNYSYPFSTANAHCPDGIVFKFPSGSEYDFQSMQTLTESIDSKFKEQLDLYGSMGNFSGLSIPGTPPIAGLVRVMNLAPISSTDKTFVFWSQCTVKDNDTNTFIGQIELVGKTSLGTTFARFTSHDPRKGGECPSGTVFISEDKAGLDGLPLLAYDDGIELG